MEATGTESIGINATAERAYNLLIDLSRMGEVSPTFASDEWLDGATAPHAGAHFMAHPTDGSDVECRVLRAMPGEEWAFKANLAAETPETWRYTFDHAGEGSVVTVKWDGPTPPGDVAKSLTELKRIAES